MLDSTINNSAYYNSDEDDGESDTKRDSFVSTHTSDRKKRKVTDTDTMNVNSPQKYLINPTLPMIIQLTDPRIKDWVASGRGTTHARQKISLKVIITDTAHSGARVFQDPTVVNQKDMYGKIP